MVFAIYQYELAIGIHVSAPTIWNPLSHLPILPGCHLALILRFVQSLSFVVIAENSSLCKKKMSKFSFPLSLISALCRTLTKYQRNYLTVSLLQPLVTFSAGITCFLVQWPTINWSSICVSLACYLFTTLISLLRGLHIVL